MINNIEWAIRFQSNVSGSYFIKVISHKSNLDVVPINALLSYSILGLYTQLEGPLPISPGLETPMGSAKNSNNDCKSQCEHSTVFLSANSCP